jgi:hypothetical protein
VPYDRRGAQSLCLSQMALGLLTKISDLSGEAHVIFRSSCNASRFFDIGHDRINIIR